MHKINIVCFAVLLFLFSSYSKAQTKRKLIDTVVHAAVKEAIFFNTNKADRITLPFGYSAISKELSIDSILSMVENGNMIKEINALRFDQPVKKDLVLLPEEYDVVLPFSKHVNEKYDNIKISSRFLYYGTYSMYFMAVYNTVRYTDPFIEKMYLISTKEGQLIDIKRIFLHHEGEMGNTNYTLFNIDKNYIISLRDYEFSEDPFRIKPLHKYRILPSGKFSRYYDHDGFYKNDEEQGMVKNHSREGRWIEFKLNSCIDLKNYPTFTDPYTYLEATYKNGLPVGKWKFYKLLQKYNEETGLPILNTRQKGQLIYTEVYREGLLEKREFQD
ncbi:hypothetical protein [Sphingobacterium athyrii]|uniref:YARHG domain-containing protein n=1 Tax=Sphingobacterium athyrii TaxID=2152717 RepID=A0A363NTC4_9SPHI|nr:hypothetical protein [Sphingobacterium athyrii]PUV23911.1 hypothetical protein DCO56_11025 [Sphingobacterium athyrii]